MSAATTRSHHVDLAAPIGTYPGARGVQILVSTGETF